MTGRKRVSLEEFERFVNLSENADKLFEYIGGEIVEVLSRPYASSLIGTFIYHIGIYAQDDKLGYITGKRGGYAVSGERYHPDLAFISRKRQPELPKEGYVPNPPELVVEINSPSTHEFSSNLLIKTANYLAAGTVVWLVHTEAKTVELHVPSQPVKILGIYGTLDGGEVLPGFKLPVKDIFPE